MRRIKPIAPEEAIAIVEKRRRQARDYYARMRDDARHHREAQLNLFPHPSTASDQSDMK